MKFAIITLFPEMFEKVLGTSILGRAREKGIFEYEIINLRDYGIGPRKQVDDTPYGGGAGMVLRVDVMAEAIAVAKQKTKNPPSQKATARAGKKQKILLMTPQGKRLIQSDLMEMASASEDYIIICGHYEGFDERIRGLVDQEISIGDFVLTGGEVPAMALIDGIVRLLPGVLGREESHQDESHSEVGRIEYPHYTRPEVWKNQKVPEVLLSGDHSKIDKWRETHSESKSRNV